MSVAAYWKESSRILADVNRVVSQFAILTADGSGEQYQQTLELAFSKPIPGRPTLLNAAIASTSDTDVRKRIEAVDDAMTWLVNFAFSGPTKDFEKSFFSTRDALRKLEPFAVRTPAEILEMIASWSQRWRWEALFQFVADCRKHRETASQLRADAKASECGDELKHLAKVEDVNAEVLRCAVVAQTDELDEITNWVRTERPEALRYVPCVSVWQDESSSERHQELADKMRGLEGQLRALMCETHDPDDSTPEKPKSNEDLSTITVDIECLRATIGGRTYDLQGERAARYLKAIASQPGVWMTSPAIANSDPQLAGSSRFSREKNSLPAAIRKMIDAGRNGHRLNLEPSKKHARKPSRKRA